MSGDDLSVAIEDLPTWYPALFVESHVVAFVAITGQYSVPPAEFTVEFEDSSAPEFSRSSPGSRSRLTLAISWTEDTVDKAERLRATIQSKPLLELAAVAVALVLATRVLHLGQLDVTRYGDRVDFRSLSTRRVLEISGTENLTAMTRRHREKTAQALANPFGWDAYIIVCGFSDQGHQVRLTGTSFPGAAR